MKFIGTLALATAALAAPTKRQAAITDADILQYALTLEHLENTFYKGALSKFTEKDFVDAGFTSEYFTNLKYIAHDEESHVEALTAALSAAGATPVTACTYSFPYTDPKSFITLSSVLEGVGTSAYLGGAGLITSKEYLGVAGSILVTEALHTSLQRFNLGEVAMANPYGTALGLNEVYTLAATFITACPSTNIKLPVMAFPALTAVQGEPTAPGIEFVFDSPTGAAAGQFLTFISGLAITSMPATIANGKISATVPATAMGQTYVVLTKSNVTSTLSDDQVVAGPAILEVTPPSPTYNTAEE